MSGEALRILTALSQGQGERAYKDNWGNKPQDTCTMEVIEGETSDLTWTLNYHTVCSAYPTWQQLLDDPVEAI